MEKLAFCDYHNMVSILEKTEYNTDFHQIVDFLEASHIRVETMDGETKILAQVNGRQRTISESSIRRHLKINDKEATNRTYNFSKMIFDGMMRNVKSKGKFLIYPRYREIFPTDTSLDTSQDRENIAKTSAMPHEALPRVTSLGGGKGRGCSKHEGVDQGEDLLDGNTIKDSDKSADKESDSTYEMANVLGPLGAKNILASGGLSVATPTTRVTRSSRGVIIGSSSPISANIPSISKKDKGKEKMTKPEQPKQAKRDSEIARIHAEKELEMMIAELDRSNKMVAKYLSEYEQAEVGLSHDEKVEFTIKVTDKKANELWVELKRLYEPDSRDPLWALQRISVPTADVYISKKFSTVEDFALLHENKIY
nr:hypothetical protein [Tanacetum cinerariifolium]